MKKILVLLAILTCFFVFHVPVLADSYGYEIKTDDLLAQEKNTTFGIKITEKKVVEDVFDVEKGEGNDALVITVRNKTSGSIENIELYYVIFNSEHRTVPPEGVDVVPGADPVVNMSKKEGLYLSEDEEYSFVIRVNYDSLCGASAIVKSYSFVNGSEVQNSSFEVWKNYAMGVVGANTTILD